MTDFQTLRHGVIAAFREQLSGRPVSPRDVGYDKARRVWNARIDRRPALIAFCTNDKDVVAAVRFVREHECSWQFAAADRMFRAAHCGAISIGRHNHSVLYAAMSPPAASSRSADFAGALLDVTATVAVARPAVPPRSVPCQALAIHRTTDPPTIDHRPSATSLGPRCAIATIANVGKRRILPAGTGLIDAVRAPPRPTASDHRPSRTSLGLR